MFRTTSDGCVKAGDDRIIFFSLKRFICDMVQGNCCFICGARPNTVPFNDEHILPDWILRKYKLHARTITLPNGTSFRYDQFKIPCCKSCNSRMGKELEEPIRELFNGGYKAVAQFVKTHGPWLLFGWMCLIFLKTHLKDNTLRFYRDHRKGDETIGKFHAWEDLHHVHCMARAFYTQCNLQVESLGSLLVLPAKMLPYGEAFDYGDLSVAQTMLLRIDDTALIAVFNDSQACVSAGIDELAKITGPLSPLQLREIAVRMAANNLHLEERPTFATEVDLFKEEYSIVGVRPKEISFIEWNHEVVGKLMTHYCGPLLLDSPEKSGVLENLKTGNYTFILNDRGEFASDHMDPIAHDSPSDS
jgi:hypothetical protein